jgi:N-acyl homoserine lactone hydrolase
MKTMFRFAGTLLLGLTLSATARAQEEVSLVAPGGIQAAIQELIPGFERTTPYKVKPTFGSGLGTKKQVAEGVPFDVPIIQPPYPEVLDSGHVVVSSATPLARVAVGVAVRTGQKKPDISTPAKVKALLLSVKSFSYPDPSGGAAAGVSFTKTLQDLRIYEQVKSKIHLSRGGAAAMEAVANSEVEIGLTFYSEILTEKGVQAVGTLPESISPRTSLVAFVSSHAKNAEAANSLVRYLSSPAAAATYRKVGMEPAASAGAPAPPKTARLYVLDCGMLNIDPAGVARYHVTEKEVVEPRMPVPCFLVVHPKGTLLWDTGTIPDADVERAAPKPALYDVNPVSHAVVSKTLKSQLAALGYAPSDITYVAISHAHKDHTANLNQFAASTWLVRPIEREFMFRPGNERVEPKFYNQLERSKWIDISKDEATNAEYDVFGDGQVVIKAAPGHTPGHEVLVLSLAKSGRIMVAGDLYHYPPERTFQRKPPDNEFNVEQSAASRAMIEEYVKKTKTQVWIQHDFRTIAKLKKSPAFYE